MTEVFNPRDALRKKLADFLPEKIFDAHAHIYDASFMPTYAGGDSVFSTPRETAADFRKTMEALLPRKAEVRALLIPTPDPMLRDRSLGLRDAAAAFMAKQLDENPDCFGEVFVHPEDTPEEIEALLLHERIRGFKCYYFTSPNGIQAPAYEFLPESAWQVANKHGMVITLHLACDGALSDPRNLNWIEEMAGKYPDAKLILAHCARAFAAWTCIEPLKRLSRYPNIYYDLAAICEAAPMQACIRNAGVDHVLWGSDFPVSRIVGRAVSLAERFLWINEPAVRDCGDKKEVSTILEESLTAAYIAFDLLGLSRGEVQSIFYDNAVRLLV